MIMHERRQPESWLERIRRKIRQRRLHILAGAAGLAVFAVVGQQFDLFRRPREPRLGNTLESYARISEQLKALPTKQRGSAESRKAIPNWAHGLAIRGLTVGAAEEASPRIDGSEILIQLDPSTAPDRVAGYIDGLRRRYQLDLVKTVPEIGLVVMRLPAVTPEIALRPEQTTAVQNVTSLRREEARRAVSLQAIIEQVRKEEWVRAATPNVVLTANDLPVPGGKGREFDGEVGWDWDEAADGYTARKKDGNWGLKYMNFPSAWNFRGAIKRRNPNAEPHTPQIGVIDNGFADHEDLENVAISPITVRKANDHGSHVAGIIGGTWNGARGIEGCLPGAHLVCATMDTMPVGPDLQQPDFKFMLEDAISILSRFLAEHPKVRVINISLGYNWRRNGGINPVDHPAILEEIRNAGTIMWSVADVAWQKKVIIVSAAGNDSSALSRREAQWASPFNWAALNSVRFRTGVELPPAHNVVVVESVDRNGKPSAFSNTRGCVAAPGENILSTVWTTNPDRIPGSSPAGISRTNYAVMSGTSMAAPHVTGLIGLMYAYNPGLPMTEVLRILGADQNRPARPTTPILNAFDALVACRSDSLKDLADLNNDGAVDLADFAIFKAELKRVESLGGGPNRYLRADLNGSGQLSRAPGDKRTIAGTELSDLDVMIKAWSGTPPDLAAMLDQ